ncbi:MAG: tRNA (adenosine(37)-N6)-threonylcarbamoyltransferase complex dimerization subunit type 1 TsaB [Burkholderiaceae bacterium]|nr:tRNA (adenosine(37)-N6)-threonylcarbamoyltransferase complex dimerization subunit type 1 TsaB [Burkholderiaceae bacterium]
MLSASAPSHRRNPRLLALDTATERIAVALVDGDRQWLADEAGGALASQHLLPRVFALLGRAGLALADLDAIAFGRGPGAFTGLRSACSVAQGLAFGAGLPVLAIDSLALIAEDAFAQHPASEIWVAMDARMGQVYAAAYRRHGEHWQGLHAPALWTLAALAEAWRCQPPVCIAGSALEVFGPCLPTGAAPCIATPHDRAAALARLARAAWQRGEGLDAALALPLYLRDKVALTTAEREAAALAKASA